MDDVHPETQARMVDVTGKAPTERRAAAACLVRMSEKTRDVVMRRELSKGDALESARIAGIMGAKKTSELIPLCHPIGIGGIDVVLEAREAGIEITAEVVTFERTGVEMEALVAVTTAALTLYDMVKGIEREVEINDVRLLSKSGGRSGTWSR
ncbi:MAG: cyclic pyranopterin monophosphate synthase MoaC [Actinomycetota bacterium]|nr:cyclic pyranopterin monophosphate synthase MoaC [Actinomycetota bacterium]